MKEIPGLLAILGIIGGLYYTANIFVQANAALQASSATIAIAFYALALVMMVAYGTTVIGDKIDKLRNELTHKDDKDKRH